GAEGVFDGGAADAHGVGSAVEAILHGVDHRLMLPALDPARLFAGRASVLQRTHVALGRPVDVQVHAVFHRGEAAGQPLASRTAIGVVLGDVDEVLLAEPALGLGAGGERL